MRVATACRAAAGRVIWNCVYQARKHLRGPMMFYDVRGRSVVVWGLPEPGERPQNPDVEFRSAARRKPRRMMRRAPRTPKMA